MRTFITAILLMTSAPASAGAQSSQVQPDVFHGVVLVDPEREMLQPDTYIVVADGKIVEIGQGLPDDAPNAKLHDRSGQFAMPGLIDTHAHMTWGPVGVAVREGAPVMVIEDRPDITAFNARKLLSFGVTTVRNPAGSMEDNGAYSQMVASGQLSGPEAFHAAEVIDHLPIKVDGPVVEPGPELSVSQIVERQSEAGAAFIKFYTGLSEAELAEGIEVAHAHGLQAIAHLSDVSWTRAAELGIDALLHMMPISPDLLPEDVRADYIARRREGGFAFFEWYEAADLDAAPIQDMLKTLAREQVHVDATLVAFLPAFYGDTPGIFDRDIDIAHPDMVANWRTTFRFDSGWSEGDYLRAQTVWPKVLDMTRRLYEAGIPMTIGTDMANPFVAPGISMSREMTLHREAGIPVWAIMRMATIEGARSLRIDDRTGRLAPGYEADILFVGADPLQDFANLEDVRAVLSDGKLYDPARLRQSGGDDR